MPADIRTATTVQFKNSFLILTSSHYVALGKLNENIENSIYYFHPMKRQWIVRNEKLTASPEERIAITVPDQFADCFGKFEVIIILKITLCQILKLQTQFTVERHF